MKKILSAIICSAALLPCGLALGPGDDAPALTVRKWARGPEITLQPPAPVTAPASATPVNMEKPLPFFRVIVLWGTWSPASPAAVEILNSIRSRYPEREIAAIMRDSDEDFDKNLATAKPPKFSMAMDKNDKTSMVYMPGEVIFPKAFIVNEKRLILWTGEIIDLPEAIQQIVSGKYDMSKAKELYKYRKELTAALQSGDDNRIMRASSALLAEEPADSFGLRVRMFVYENSGKQEEAVKFISGQIERAPKESRLYFLKMELLLRESSPDIKELHLTMNTVFKHFAKDPSVINELTWFILDRVPFRLVPVDLLRQCADTALQQLPPAAPLAERVSCRTAKARALFFLGRISEAVKLQRETVKMLDNQESDLAVTNAILQVMEAAEKQQSKQPAQ